MNYVVWEGQGGIQMNYLHASDTLDNYILGCEGLV